MDLELRGKQVLITGASKGIGAGVARGFAEEGADVHLVARSRDALEALAGELGREHGVEATVHPVDLSVSGTAAALLGEIGPVDVLVNNAGAIPGGDLSRVDEARWREAWDLKVFGYVDMTRHFYGAMRETGQGVVVNVVGLAGEKPDYGYVAGSAGNAALMAFTRAMGGRSLDDGVRVVAVNPGPVETERLVGLFKTRAESESGDPERWREYLGNLPLARAASVREVSNLVLFLASPRASYMSGTVVTIDGGLSSRGASF